MTTPTQTETRPDIDIAEDIRSFLRDFDPVKQSRQFFAADVSNGVVTLVGNVRARVARRVLVDYIAEEIDGVQKVIADELYDDEHLRLTLGHVLPRGVQVHVNYGSVVVSGTLPAGIEPDDIVEKVKSVSGVRINKIFQQFN